ncbi:KAP family NTPase [Escherichia coli]|nr:KAP family NTPase [Escherichia coli]
MNQPHADNLQGQHPDRAICSADEDQYGFIHIATQLAVAVKGIGREGSAVIGIEGPWGSGKTSLLNLLRNALVEQIEERTFVLTISPLARREQHKSGGIVTASCRQHHCC